MRNPSSPGVAAWIASLLSALALATLLAGCAAVQLSPAYDEQIDRGLTELYAGTSGFVDRMIESAGTPAGTLAQNGTFYSDSLARMDALIARAEAHRVLEQCPSTAIMTRVLDGLRLPAQVRSQIGTLPRDECQIVLFGLVRQGLADMRELHRLRGDRGFPPEARDQLITGGVGAQLRAAIAVEIAKRAE
jgi:hypothetical protein